MITFDTSFTGLGIDVSGSVDEVPINEFLLTVHIDRYGVTVMDTSGQWGLIKYQDTSFTNNISLFNYLYPFTQTNKLQTKKIEICSADLQTSNSIPIELVPAPGIGRLIIPISMSYVFKYNSIVYDFADDLYIHCPTNTDALAIFQIQASILNAAQSFSTITLPIVASPVAGPELQFEENTGWVLKAKTSDATQGNSRITIYITYSVVEESWYDGVYCT